MNIDFEFLGDTLSKLLAAVPTTLGLFFASLIVGGMLSLVTVADAGEPELDAQPFCARLHPGVSRLATVDPDVPCLLRGLGQFPAVRKSFLWPLLRVPYVCAIVSLALCTVFRLPIFYRMQD